MFQTLAKSRTVNSELSYSFMALLSLLFLLIIPGSSDAGELQNIDGVPHILNEAEPSDGHRTLQLKEMWRINIEDEEELIGVISSALSGSDGSVWLADEQLGQVMIYSSTGEHLRTVSREGEGPGELNTPRGLLWLPGGGLGITDRKQGQITQIDNQGMPMSSLHLSNAEGEPMASAYLSKALCSGGTLAACGTQFRFDTGTPTQSRFFSIFDNEGKEIHRLMDAPSGFDFSAQTYDELANYFVDRGSWAINEQGLVYHAPHFDRYLIEVHNSTGKLVQVIERKYKPTKRTAEELEETKNNNSMTINGEAVPLDCDLQKFNSFVSTINSLPDGRIWVKNGSDNMTPKEGIDLSFDVFDAEGHFREVVNISCEMDSEKDQLLPLADGRWILLKNIHDARNAMYASLIDDDDREDTEEESELMEIICFGGN